MHEHLDTKENDFQMLMRLKRILSIFFLFLLFLFKNNFTSAEIAFSILRDTRLFGGVTTTDSTFDHLDHLLSWAY